MKKGKFIRTIVSAMLILGLTLPGNTAKVLADTLSRERTFKKDGSRYISYASDRGASGSKVGFDKIVYNLENASLLVNGEEKIFEKNIFAHATSYIYYTDIQDYGYDKFESWVGLKNSSRNKNASVTFRIYLDGKLSWESGEIKSNDESKFVSIDISDTNVLKLEVDSNGSNAYDHALWGDAKFIKNEPTPYLKVSDKEFAYPGQVTKENILEGTFARTLSGPIGDTVQPVQGRVRGTIRNGKEGNDLSDNITYKTDYIEGSTGDFNITYYVTDSQGYTRSRTVKGHVRSKERVVLNADIEYLKTPFASFEYMCRDYLSEEGKKAFDYTVNKLLHFTDDVENYPKVNVWGEDLVKVTLNLQEQGIYMSTNEVGYLNPMLMDNEPRIYHIKDWGTEYTTSEGMVNTVTFYVPQKYSVDGYYEKRLKDVEVNTSKFLSKYEEGMTDAQALKAVLYPYADWIKYQGGGQLMDEALANGQGVCGGNARGGIYLSKRIGIKSYWVRTGSHAWLNVKLNDPEVYLTKEGDTGKSSNVTGYYRVDLLARPGCFISVDGGSEKYRGHHAEIWFDRSIGYPDMSMETLPFAYTAWPTSTLNVNKSEFVIGNDEVDSFNPYYALNSANNIYMGNIKNNVIVDDGGLKDNISNGKFTPGIYNITYSHTDNRGNKISDTAKLKVVGGGVMIKDLQPSVQSAGNIGAISLWDGEKEVNHSENNDFYINNGGTIKVDVTNKNFSHIGFWVSANVTVRTNIPWGNQCDFRPAVKVTYQDGTEEDIYRHDMKIGWYSTQKLVTTKIPDKAAYITLYLTDRDNNIGNNKAAFGNIRFYGDIPELNISGVENNSAYESEVTPIIENAKSYSLSYESFDSVMLNNESEEAWVSGETLTKPGIYTLSVIDYLNKEHSIKFTIGKAPVKPTVSGIEENNNNKPGVKPIISNALKYELYKEDNIIEWNNGDEINEEGNYKLVLYYYDNNIEKSITYNFIVKQDEVNIPPSNGGIEIPEENTKPSIPSEPEDNDNNVNTKPDVPENKPDDEDVSNSENGESENNSSSGSVSTRPDDEIKRSEIIGANRYETAALIADKFGKYETAILVNAESTMSDGLSSAALSGNKNAPILLTKSKSIPNVTMQRLKNVSTVYIIGGENAISDNVEKLLQDKKVIRIGGSTRYETSEMIAAQIGNYNKAFIVNGNTGDADAISASSVAAKYSAPIILTNGKTSEHSKKAGTEYYIIGGDKAVSESLKDKYSAERIYGSDRYKTNREVISKFYSDSPKYYYANGLTLVDALTVSILSKDNGVVLVSDKSDNTILSGKSLVQVGGMKFNINIK